MKRLFGLVLLLAILAASFAPPGWAEESTTEDIQIMPDEIAAIEEESLTLESNALDINLSSAPAEEASVEDANEAEETETTEETEQTEATTIGLSEGTIVIGVKENYKRLSVIALPENSVLPAVTWRSDNKKIAKVDKKTGVITGVKYGNTTVYAKIKGSDVEVPCTVKVRNKPKKVSLNKKTLTLSAGMAYQLDADVPSKQASGTYRFSSSKSGIASVDKYTGLITAKKAGSTTITVKTYNGRTAKCKVTVVAEPAYVDFAEDQVALYAGQEPYSLNATAMTAKDKATPSALTYTIDESSPNADCITLDESTGVIQGLDKGEAVVRATAHNGAYGTCVVSVDYAPAAISLNEKEISIGVKEAYADLLAELTPPDGESSCIATVTWKSSNSKIAKVDPDTGVVTGVKNGSCKVKALTVNGIYAICKVKVLKAPTSSTVTLSPSHASLKVGSVGKFSKIFEDGYGGSVSYSSSDEGVATVDENGLVTGIAAGTCEITVTTYNGITKKATIDVLSEDDGLSEDPSDDGSKSADDEKIDYVISLAKSKLDAPYVYGAFGPNRFDCSGFMYWCFKQVNIKLKDSAYKQGYDSRYPKVDYSDLRKGDLVFFDTVDDSDLSDHSALYIGDGQFIHASSAAGKVIISKFTSYYKRTFSWGRRVFD